MARVSLFRRALSWVACGVLVLSVTLLASTTSYAEQAGGAPVVPRADAASLDAGWLSGCAITSSGTLRCWGFNVRGDLAQGNTGSIGDDPGESTVPVDLGPGRTATAVSLGAHSCAILDTGALRCWGWNAFGELAQGNTANIGDNLGETTVGVDLGAGRRATAISAGGLHTCAVLDNGILRCWGRNDSGQLAQGNTDDIGDNLNETTVAVDVGPGRTVTAVSAGRDSTCAILDNGSVRCWGANADGQLAQGGTTPIGGSNLGDRTVAVDLGSGHTATAITVGFGQACAVLETGAVRCWGLGTSGQLGNGGVVNVGDDKGETTAAFDLDSGTAIAVATGGATTCVLLTGGAVRCAGDGSNGQLGQGGIASTGAGRPVTVNLGRPAVSISVGTTFACAVLDDSTVRCWGANNYGQLGQGSSTPYGDSAGETPNLLPPVAFGGQLIGRDTDGDGRRDSVDTCPTVAAGTASGCAAVVPPVVPEATWTGKKVTLKAFVALKKPGKGCPRKATVKVTTRARSGPVRATEQLRARKVTLGGVVGCQVTGRIRLSTKPRTTAKVKVKVSGTNLRTRTLIAVKG